MSIDLMPCPFCGSTPHHALSDNSAVVCRASFCPLRGTAILIPEWNTRATMRESLEAELAELRAWKTKTIERIKKIRGNASSYKLACEAVELAAELAEGQGRRG